MTAAERERVRAAVRERVAQAPPLSPAQRDRLAVLLGPVVRVVGKREAA